MESFIMYGSPRNILQKPEIFYAFCHKLRYFSSKRTPQYPISNPVNLTISTRDKT